MIQKTKDYIKVPKRALYLGVAGLAIGWAARSLRPQKIPIDVAEVQRGTFQALITDEALTHFKERFVVSAPADGLTPELDLEVGDPVEKGQTLFTFIWDRDFAVKSPATGYVIKIFEPNKRHVPRGTPILELADPKSIQLKSSILSEEVVRIRPGQKVVVRKWGKGLPLLAEVEKVDPSAKQEVSALGVKEQRVDVHMKVLTEPEIWKGLGDGFRVEISVIVNEVKDALLVPVGAITGTEADPRIYLLKNGKIEQLSIQIKDRNSTFARIEGEPQPGDQVVMYPGPTLKVGDEVEIRKKISVQTLPVDLGGQKASTGLE
jgi:multidrug efflux pump subunit AcrA (membrane-fusion protein)